MSRYIKSGERVFEFGAGRCQLREMLPPNASYTPSDLVARLPGTYVCDLNHRPLPMFAGHDVAVCSGVLEYFRNKFISKFVAVGYRLHQESSWERHGIYVFERAEPHDAKPA